MDKRSTWIHQKTLQTYLLKKTTHIQRIVGSFLYYARVVDNTNITVVNEIAATQASPSKKKKDATIMLMDYLYTHTGAKIRYKGSNMKLYVDSYAAYLVAPKEKSRIEGYFYLSERIHNMCKISHSTVKWLNSYRILNTQKCGVFSDGS